MNEHSNGYEQEEDAHGSEKRVATGHAKREDSTEAEASAEAEGQKCTEHLFLRESAGRHVVKVNDDKRPFAVVFDELLHLVDVIGNAVDERRCKRWSPSHRTRNRRPVQKLVINGGLDQQPGHVRQPSRGWMWA